MRVYFKRVNGENRWFLVNANGEKIAKFYVKPVFGFLLGHNAALADYRETVNQRCDAKGKARAY